MNPLFLKPSTWHYLQLDWINLYWNDLYQNYCVSKRPVTIENCHIRNRIRIGVCLLALIPNFFHKMYPKLEKVRLLDTEYFNNIVRLTPYQCRTWTHFVNRPLPSSKNPHFQNEARCTTFLVKVSFVSMRMKNDFHIKDWAPTLLLRQTSGGTWKWPIIT